MCSNLPHDTEENSRWKHDLCGNNRESVQTLRCSFPLFDHIIALLRVTKSSPRPSSIHRPFTGKRGTDLLLLCSFTTLKKPRKQQITNTRLNTQGGPSVSVTRRARAPPLCGGSLPWNSIWSHCNLQQVIVYWALILTSSDSSQLPVMADPPQQRSKGRPECLPLRITIQLFSDPCAQPWDPTVGLLGPMKALYGH